MIRFGILGCGAHGERYLRHLKAGDVPGAEPVALWRRDRGAAQVLAARYGVRVHAAWRDLIEDPAVDAVIVATPPGLHPEPILAAARAGKPVLAEKPLAAVSGGPNPRKNGGLSGVEGALGRAASCAEALRMGRVRMAVDRQGRRGRVGRSRAW